jgi:ABC-type dipeptide/oligopeptide/nickel transport system permease component
MRKYLAQRLLIAVPTLFGVTLLIFIAMRVLPGDPLAAISGEGGGLYVLSKEQLSAARASLGLDRPYVVQYLDWLRDASAATWGNRSGAASRSASSSSAARPSPGRSR